MRREANRECEHRVCSRVLHKFCANVLDSLTKYLGTITKPEVPRYAPFMVKAMNNLICIRVLHKAPRLEPQEMGLSQEKETAGSCTAVDSLAINPSKDSSTLC
jgi:hypothetical protein